MNPKLRVTLRSISSNGPLSFGPEKTEPSGRLRKGPNKIHPPSHRPEVVEVVDVVRDDVPLRGIESFQCHHWQ